MDEKCRKEIAGLHRFFQDWLTGRLPATDEAFARFAGVLDDGFQIITPTARIIGRKELLRSFRGEDRRVVRRESNLLEDSPPAGGTTWSDDREMVAIARARSHATLGNRRRAEEILAEALRRLDEPFGRSLVLMERARLGSRAGSSLAPVLPEEVKSRLEPMGFRWLRGDRVDLP